MINATSKSAPKSPNPVMFAVIMAISQLTFNAFANPASTHCGEASFPSHGTEPSGVNQTMADLLSSNLQNTF